MQPAGLVGPVRVAPQAAHGLLASDGTAVTVINDSAGFIAQRVIATSKVPAVVSL